MATRTVTLEEVRKHNKPNDLWVVVHGHVYDVTKWKDTHPGGWEILAANANGKDNFEQVRFTRLPLHSSSMKSRRRD